MEEHKIDEFVVENGAEATPIIVLTGTLEEFERFCSSTNRNTKTAIAIRQGFQIPMYENLAIALYGSYWLNTAYDSPEYRDRIFKIKMKELESNG